MFGKHNKVYNLIQWSAEGHGGPLGVKIYPNTLEAKYPWTIPQANMMLTTPMQADLIRPLNIKGQRCFVEFSTNSVGASFNISKVILTGWASPWSPIAATGGGNIGIS
jgi:hypothetical protein